MIIHVHYRAPHQWILPLCLWIMSHRLHRSGFSPQTFRGCSDVSELLKMWFNVGISQIYWLPVLLRLVFRCLSVSDELVDLLLAPLAAELIGWAARCGFNQTHRRVRLSGIQIQTHCWFSLCPTVCFTGCCICLWCENCCCWRRRVLNRTNRSSVKSEWGGCWWHGVRSWALTLRTEAFGLV